MTRTERAHEQFSTSSACSQSVAIAFADDMGMDAGTVHRCMAGFGGGMGTQQLTCGAITGGVFALSAVFGTVDSPTDDEKAFAKEKVDAFFSAVRERLGAVDCRDLLGCSLVDAKEQGLFGSRCPEIIRVCVEEAEKLL